MEKILYPFNQTDVVCELCKKRAEYSKTMDSHYCGLCIDCYDRTKFGVSLSCDNLVIDSAKEDYHMGFSAHEMNVDYNEIHRNEPREEKLNV